MCFSFKYIELYQWEKYIQKNGLSLQVMYLLHTNKQKKRDSNVIKDMSILADKTCMKQRKHI